MEIIYDKNKAEKLLRERNIDLAKVEKILMLDGPVEIISNKARQGQHVFLVKYDGYIHAVPFLVNSEGVIIIKTAYPSRKYNKIYGGRS